MSEIGRGLAQFRQTVDDPESYFIADLHLHHFSGETCAHALGILELELHLSSTALDEVKEQHRGEPMEFLVGGVLTHIEDLRQGRSRFLTRR